MNFILKRKIIVKEGPIKSFWDKVDEGLEEARDKAKTAYPENDEKRKRYYYK